ncbi:hypothetical protein HQ533_05795 [Candidatus Woesearchaeota archaeon]|nr:hypothetical protein [Candidatus Woesearchaeota archaeon]
MYEVIPKRVSDYSQLMEYNSIPRLMGAPEQPLGNAQAYLNDLVYDRARTPEKPAEDLILRDIKRMANKSTDLDNYIVQDILKTEELYEA